MLKKIANIFFLVFFLSFIFLITKYYISEKNIVFTNKSRLSYLEETEFDDRNLPLLKNDTTNIIIFNDDVENFKNKRKKRLWEKLIFNNNE